MSRTLYLKVQAVTNHDAPPADYRSAGYLTFAGRQTTVPKYAQVLDGEINDVFPHGLYDVLEFGIAGATFVQPSPNYFQETATFNYEGISHRYGVWRTISVPDDFQIPPDKIVGPPSTTMPSDAQLLAGWQQVSNDPYHTTASFGLDGDGLFVRGVQYARGLLDDALGKAVWYQIDQAAKTYAGLNNLSALWTAIKNAKTVGSATETAFKEIFAGFNELFTSFGVNGAADPNRAAALIDGSMAGALTTYASAIRTIAQSSPALEAFIQGVDVVARVYPAASPAGVATFTVDVQNGGSIGPTTVGGQESAMYVFGGSAASQITGSRVNDVILGGGGADRIDGRGGQDFISGGQGDDVIASGGGIVRGDEGQDRITVTGTASIQGGIGDDTITIASPNASFQTIDGGAGWDVVAFTAPVRYSQNSRLIMNPSPDPIRGVEEIRGSGGDDVLIGSEIANVFRGMAGNDNLEGSGGSDTLQGGAGNDNLNGGAGNDRIEGGDDDDLMWGGAGNDTIDGGSGRDTAVFSGARSDYRVVTLANGDVQVTDLRAGSPDGTDTLRSVEVRFFAGSMSPNYQPQGLGAPAGEVKFGTRGNDILRGGPGDDTFYLSTGADTIDGGDGIDLLAFSQSVSFSADPVATRLTVNLEANTAWVYWDNSWDSVASTVLNVENVQGLQYYSSFIFGNDNENHFFGGNEADHLYGRGGDDWIDGGDGYHNLLVGENGNDTLLGGNGPDSLYGGDDNDRLIGSAANDLLDGGNGVDTVDYSWDRTGVQIDLAFGEATGIDIQTDRIVNVENALGGSGDDRLVGDGAANRLDGRGGRDTLDGGAGDDTLIVGHGGDLLTGGAGDDRFVYDYGSGAARITDFAAGPGSEDRIDLTALDDVTSLAAIRSRATQVGADTVIDFGGGNTLTLQNVALAALAQDDFIFAQVPNRAPVFNADGPALLTQAENTRAVITVGAADPDGDTISYSIASGADARLFQIDRTSGALSFVTGPDFETPADADRDNRYDVVVRASDGSLSDEQAFTVQVTDVAAVDLLVSGNTSLAGTGENDRFRYESGSATLDGGAGRDTLDFSRFASAVWVNLGANGPEGWTMDRPNLTGGTWRAIVEASNVEDLIGTAYDDLLRGNGGDNTFTYTGGLDTVDGVGGNDTIDFSRFGSAVWVDLASNGREAWTRDNAGVTGGTWRAIADLAGIETVAGTAYADDLRGDGNANRLIGGGGDDVLNGRGGNDILEGGAGFDTAVFANRLAGYRLALNGSDIIVTGEGTDRVLDDIETFRFADATLTRGQLLDELTPPVVTRNADTVSLSRLGGTVNALDGDDVLQYRGGFVTVDGGAGSDTLDFSGFGAAVWVNLGASGAEGWTMDRASLTGGTWRAIADVSNVENLVGTAYDDLLRGNGSDNTFVYTGGLDTVDGMGGNDTIDFSRFGSAVWVDLASSGREAWTRDNAGVTSGTWRAIADVAGIETAVGTAYADDLRGNGDANRLLGGGGRDILNGRAGNDILDGGAGIDVLSGGIGNDRFVFLTPGEINGDTITDFESVAGQNTGDSLVIRAGYSALVFGNGSTAVTYNGVTETIFHPGVTLSLANDMLVV